MKIQKISSPEFNHGTVYPNRIIKRDFFCEKPDSVSFKAAASIKIIALVGAYGYRSLKNDIPKADFKNEIARRINNPNTANDAKEVIDTLFALAKTVGRDEPKSIAYQMRDNNQGTSLQAYRDLSLKKLFPLIPEMVEDVNSGHSAKVAMLNSMIDTGEYVDSKYFFKAFKNLPSFYDEEKKAMAQKVLKDKNVITKIHKDIAMDKATAKAESDANYEYKEFTDNPISVLLTPLIAIPVDGVKRSNWVKKRAKQIFAEDIEKTENKRATANTAMLLGLDPDKFKTLYTLYDVSIKAEAKRAFKYVKNLLRKDGDDYPKNTFYKYYSNAFRTNGRFGFLSTSEQIIAKAYWTEFMATFENDKNRLMEEFDIDRKYYDDLFKDFKLLQITNSMSDKNDAIIMLKKRIETKLASSDEDIKNSASALLDLSERHEEELKPLRKMIDESKPKPEPTDSTPLYTADGTDSMESWEEADLSTPWFVR